MSIRLCINVLIAPIFNKHLLIKNPIVYYNIEENFLTPQSRKILFLLSAAMNF